ncbi:MAG TPA: S1 RNA-binding domain-containing protein [Acidimicrobiales bacterium]|nr:S1 RNA-binding domain-containing protein [Acidimicrobiales bacterium]
MSQRHVVVDGSNIATEGRSLPSLAQLDEAVQEFRREYPDDVITVVVDATFGHRIDESELEPFKEAEAHNEVVSPPAGAIGRGDAFLLRIAERVGATVLSNDSFQEFHGEHDWLFDKGRLIGGKPVPSIGWIFTPRTPVRGPKSREAVKVAKRAKKASVSEFGSLEEEVAARRARGSRPTAASRADKAEKPEKAEKAQRPAKKAAKVSKAIALATEEAVEPDSASARRRRRRRSSGAPPSDPVNAPLTFINFVSEHPLGSEVEGEVDHFSSHGAFIRVGDAECYVPLSAMGDPPPRAAREVLKRDEPRMFVIQAFDPPRRGIELALPGFAHVAARPTDETVEDEIAEGTPTKKQAARPKTASKRGPAKKAPAKKKAAELTKAEPTKKASAKKAAAGKRAAEKRAAGKKAAEPAKKAAAKKQSTPQKAAAPTKKTAARAKAAAPAKKGAAKKAAAPAKKAAKKAAAPATKAAKAPATKAKKAAKPAKAPAPRKR